MYCFKVKYKLKVKTDFYLKLKYIGTHIDVQELLSVPSHFKLAFLIHFELSVNFIIIKHCLVYRKSSYFCVSEICIRNVCLNSK